MGFKSEIKHDQSSEANSPAVEEAGVNLSSMRGGTLQDKRDMYRIGNNQELNVGDSSSPSSLNSLANCLPVEELSIRLGLGIRSCADVYVGGCHDVRPTTPRDQGENNTQVRDCEKLMPTVCIPERALLV